MEYVHYNLFWIGRVRIGRAPKNVYVIVDEYHDGFVRFYSLMEIKWFYAGFCEIVMPLRDVWVILCFGILRS